MLRPRRAGHDCGAANVLALLVGTALLASRTAAKFTCYEGESNEESWLLVEKCEDTDGFNVLLNYCGGKKKETSCQKFDAFNSDGSDAILVETARAASGGGCTATEFVKEQYSEFHYGNKASTILCDGFLPFIHFPTPADCKKEIDAFNDAVAQAAVGAFPCKLTTQTSTATTSATTSATTTATTSQSSSATTTQSNTGSSTLTTTATSSASSTATTSATTTVSASETSTPSSTESSTVSSTRSTTQTSTVTTDTLLGPLECAVYKEGAAAEMKYLIQPKSGYDCVIVTRTLNSLLNTCDDEGAFDGDGKVGVDGNTVTCVKLPGMHVPTFLADKSVKDSSSKKQCTNLQAMMTLVLDIFLAAGDHSQRVEDFMADNNFRCDETLGTIIIKDKDRCDSLADLLSRALDKYREAEFVGCEATTATTTASSTASSSLTTTASSTATTSGSSSATSSQSSTATTSLSTTATTTGTTTPVTTIFQRIQSTCAGSMTYGRIYVNKDATCADEVGTMTTALQQCEGNEVFGSESDPKEKFTCIDSSASSLALVLLANDCKNAVADMNAMMKEFRQLGLNPVPTPSTFKCQLPFGLIKVKCDSDDVNDLNYLLAQYENGLFRNCEFTTQSTTATSTASHTGTSSLTSTATTSLSTTETTTVTSVLPGRLQCLKSDQGTLTVYFIAGPDPYFDADMQSAVLDKMLHECADHMDDHGEYKDAFGFKSVGTDILLVSTAANKCSDTAKRMNSMLAEFRRAGGYERESDPGKVACTTQDTFYFISKTLCEESVGDMNDAIQDFGEHSFDKCHFTTETTTASSTQSNSGTSTHTSTATTSFTTTATTSLSSTASSSVSSTDSSTATSTVSSSVTSTVTSTATTTESSTATTTQSNSGTSTFTTTASSTFTTTASSTQTSSDTTSGTTTESSTVSSTDSSTASSTVSSSLTSTESSTATSSVSSSVTSTGSSTATTTESSTATTTQSHSATSTFTTTASSTQTSSGTTSGTTTESSTVSSTESSTVTSTATTSATTSATTTATTSQSSSATTTQSNTGSSTITSTQTTTVSSSQTTSESSTATSSVSSTATSTHSSTASSSMTTTATSVLFGRVKCTAASKQFLGVHGKDNCDDQAAALELFMKGCGAYDDRYKTNSKLICNEVLGDYLLGASSAAACAKVGKVLHHAVNEITQFPGDKYTVACHHNSLMITRVDSNSDNGCDEFATATNLVIDKITNGTHINCEVTSPSTTQTTTQSSTASTTRSNTATSSFTTTATTSMSSTATSSVTTTASSSVTTTASTSLTSSLSSTGTTTGSLTETSTQTTSASTSVSSTASSSVSSTVTSSATSSVSTTASSSLTTTASSSATSSASSTATTSVSSSATTTQSNTGSTTVSSTATTSLSSTATSSVSTTATSSLTTTASTSLTTTQSNTGSTTGSTTPTTTVTTNFFAKMVCGGSDKKYLGVVGAVECQDQADRINEMLSDCAAFVDDYRAVDLQCNAINGEHLLGASSQDDCKNVSKALNYVVTEITQFPGDKHDVQCTLNNIHIESNGWGACDAFVETFNSVVDKVVNHKFRHCQITSPTTTQTSTLTSSQTSSVSTSATSSVTTSASSTATTSASSSATSSITSTASSSFTTTASSSLSTTASTSASTTESTSVSSTATTSLSSTRTSSATSSASSSATSTDTTSGTTSESSTVSSTDSSTATSTVSSSVTSTGSSTATTTESSTATTTQSHSATSTFTTTVSSTQTSSGTTSESSTATSSASSTATSTRSSTASSSVSSTLSSTASSTVPSTVTTTQSNSGSTTLTTTPTTTLSNSGTSTFTTTQTTTLTTFATVTPTSSASSTASTTASLTATTSLSSTATTSISSTATSTITTHNEDNNIFIYFKGDANVVDGPKFKVALASTVVAIGVPPDAINGISLQVGSIIAEVKLEGMEYGRIIAEAVKDRLVVVLVDGSVFVGYATYGEINPFAAEDGCEGFLLGNLSFPLSSFPEPAQFAGFDHRNGTDLVPSEQHAFQIELQTAVQSVVSTRFEMDDFEPIVCVITTIVDNLNSVVADLIVSNVSADFDQFDQAFFDELSKIIALGYKSGELSVEIRDAEVVPDEVLLDAVAAAFFAEDKEASSNAALLGAIIAVLAITAILFGLAFWYKKKFEAAHWAKVTARVHGARSANLFQPWSEPGDQALSHDVQGTDGASVLDQFGLGPDLGLSLMHGRGGFDKHVDYRPPSAPSVQQGYFDVGDIRAPSTLPGPASPGGHFYPGGMGSSVMGEEFGMGGGTSPTSASYANGGRASVTTLGEYKDLNPADDEYITTGELLSEYGVNQQETYRPALFDEAEPGIDEWGTHAWGASPEPTDHDFPTLKSATLIHGGGLPGYAAPEEPGIMEATPIEAMAVHFAHERGSGAGRPSLFNGDDDEDADQEFGMAHIALARVGGTPIPGATALTSIAENN